LHVSVGVPSQKSRTISSGNQSNSAKNATLALIGACLDGCVSDNKSKLTSHFFTLSFGPMISLVYHCNVVIVTFGVNIPFSFE
jgi:hypothetical protein